MNTYEFFNQGLGRHLINDRIKVGDDAPAHELAGAVLSGSHQLASGSMSRLGSGWAVVREGEAIIQLKLEVKEGDGLYYSDLTRYEAWLNVLENWDGRPVILMQFAKKPMTTGNLFITADLRCVRICGPKGVETFDWTQPPGDDAGMVQKILWKQKQEKEVKDAA